MSFLRPASSSLLQVLSALVFAAPVSVLAGEIQFSAGSYDAVENVSPLVITLTRTGDSTGAASVRVTTSDGTAAAGQDYTATAVTVNWAAGDAADKTINVPIRDDTVYEGAEGFSLTLSNVTGDTLGTPQAATVNLSDYEEGTLNFITASFEVDEDAGNAAITVNRSQGTGGEIGITYATGNGTALQATHYTLTTGTLTFADGETSKTFLVPILDNEIGHVNKTLNLTLSKPTGGVKLGTQATATLTIINDDTEFTGSLSQITPQRTGITQTAMINLGAASPFNPLNTLMQTINNIPVLEIGGLTASQTARGMVTIPVGDISYHLYPKTARQVASGSAEGIFLSQDHSGQMITADGLSFGFQPALADIDQLQSVLTEISLPALTITDAGNITIQIDQGPPPLELDDSGELVINNRFYDRYNFRPDIASSLAPAGLVAGVHARPHPQISWDNIFIVAYNNGGEMRQQTLSAAPVNGPEFIAALSGLNGVSNIRLQGLGMIAFRYGGREHRLYADVIIRRVPPESYAGSTLKTGLFSAPDYNKDGREDFRVVYANGYEQRFYYLPD